MSKKTIRERMDIAVDLMVKADMAMAEVQRECQHPSVGPESDEEDWCKDCDLDWYCIMDQREEAKENE